MNASIQKQTVEGSREHRRTRRYRILWVPETEKGRGECSLWCFGWRGMCFRRRLSRWCEAKFVWEHIPLPSRARWWKREQIRKWTVIVIEIKSNAYLFVESDLWIRKYIEPNEWSDDRNCYTSRYTIIESDPRVLTPTIQADSPCSTPLSPCPGKPFESVHVTEIQRL